MTRRAATCRPAARRHRPSCVGLSVALCVALEAFGAAGAGTWAGAELAWRGDPRPVADVPDPVAPPSRRSARRGRRGTWRAVRPGPPAVEARPQPVPAAAAAPAPLAAPPEASRQAVTHRGQAYGTAGNPRQRFDLHLPAGCGGGGVPLVVWIRGIDWRGSQQEDCPLLWLVDAGYAVASIDHRPSDDALFPAQLADCRAAVSTLQRDADLWGIDAERICVFGRAAGGHLAALVALEGPPAAAADAPDQPADAGAGGVAALGAIGAPFQLATLGGPHQRGTSAASRLVGGPLAEVREAARRASPLEHVSADAPPTLLLHAARDARVPAAQAVALDRALRAAGADSTLVLLEGDDGAVAPASVPGRAVRQFLDRVIGPGRPAADGTPPPR